MTQFFRVFALLVATAFLVAAFGPWHLKGFADPVIEKFLAFTILGLALGASFRRRLLWVVATMTLVALVIELAQFQLHGRDASVTNVIIGVIGGGIGVALGHIVATMMSSSSSQDQGQNS